MKEGREIFPPSSLTFSHLWREIQTKFFPTNSFMTRCGRLPSSEAATISRSLWPRSARSFPGSATESSISGPYPGKGIVSPPTGNDYFRKKRTAAATAPASTPATTRRPAAICATPFPCRCSDEPDGTSDRLSDETSEESSGGT